MVHAGWRLIRMYEVVRSHMSSRVVLHGSWNKRATSICMCTDSCGKKFPCRRFVRC